MAYSDQIGISSPVFGLNSGIAYTGQATTNGLALSANEWFKVNEDSAPTDPCPDAQPIIPAGKFILFTLASHGRLVLICLILFAAVGANGQTITLSIPAEFNPRQVRIITKPRSDYSAATDIPKAWSLTAPGICPVYETDALLSTPMLNKFALGRKDYLDGFKIWPEAQGVTVDSDIYIDMWHDSDRCHVIKFQDSTKFALPYGETYNAYMAQAYPVSNEYSVFRNIVQFPKYVVTVDSCSKCTLEVDFILIIVSHSLVCSQDVIGVVFTTDTSKTLSLL